MTRFLVIHDSNSNWQKYKFYLMRNKRKDAFIKKKQCKPTVVIKKKTIKNWNHTYIFYTYEFRKNE